MTGKRITRIALSDSRIYVKGRRYYFFAPSPMQNPKTGKITRWHPLCDVSEGDLKARNLKAEIIAANRVQSTGGNLPEQIETYRKGLLRKREKSRPREPARVAIFEQGNKEITRVCRVISEAFEAFNTDDPQGVDIAKFVDQWEGQRMAQVYLSRLSDFFRWAIRRGLRVDNPCQNIRVEKPDKRRRYLTNAEWHAIRNQLDHAPMAQCYIDLCYLLYQRTTEIRLLKWSQVDAKAQVIRFTPTKTERSSGASVDVPITPAVSAVLDRARKTKPMDSLYVIQSRRGQPYSKKGIWDVWHDACVRAKVEDATLKDIRAKAATDAKKAGFSKEQIRVALAHTDEGMTETYLRGLEADRSAVALTLPPAD